MKRVLFYYPSNKRSIAMETLILEVKKMGNEVLLLTTCEDGDLHRKLMEEAIPCFTHIVKASNSINYYVNNIIFFIRFCRKQKIDIVFSHLQHVNLIAVMAQYFAKAKVIVFRHHFKFHKGHFGIRLDVNKNEVLGDKIINKLAKRIIVPSSGVYNGILQHEKVKPQKLEVIPYLYNFSQYGDPDLKNVESIKEKYPAQLRLIMVSRLIPFKRHILIFPIIKKLIRSGYNIKMLVLDDGPERENLQKYINDNDLQDYIFILGYRKDFLDYMKACDLIIHPSLTEASNSVIKEMGLMEKAVAVCKGVGDFDEYIEEGGNGFFMDISEPQSDAMKIIQHLYSNKERIGMLGKNLKARVLKIFGENSDTINKLKDLLDSHH